MVDEVRYLTENQLKDRMFRGYLKSIKTSERLNKDKSIRIHDGQTSITFTLMTIAFLVDFVLVVGL